MRRRMVRLEGDAMGHLVGKNAYKKAGEKLNNLTLYSPWSGKLRAIMEELFTEAEADVYARMPYGLSPVSRIAKSLKMPQDRLRGMMERMADKGLVVDFWLDGEYHYMPSPMAIGVFEFTMMRMGEDFDPKKAAGLFHAFLQDGAFYHENCRDATYGPMRTLPHEEAVADYVEVLDYEKARSIIEQTDRYALSHCSCRHEKLHAGSKTCDNPLDTCSTFGMAADFVLRHNMGWEITKEQSLENLARSRELGLVLQADNVKRNVTAICHCCGCCCNVLLGLNTFGYPNVVMTSSFIAQIDEPECIGCGKCAKACPVGAITMEPAPPSNGKKKKKAVIDKDICLGCGVCALQCKPEALKLTPRGQKVIHPENAFERVVLQCLDRGTLQYQIFDDMEKFSHRTMAALIGAFLKLSPVKKALMSDSLRSIFLSGMKTGVKLQGRGSVLEI